VVPLVFRFVAVGFHPDSAPATAAAVSSWSSGNPAARAADLASVARVPVAVPHPVVRAEAVCPAPPSPMMSASTRPGMTSRDPARALILTTTPAPPAWRRLPARRRRPGRPAAPDTRAGAGYGRSAGRCTAA